MYRIVLTPSLTGYELMKCLPLLLILLTSQPLSADSILILGDFSHRQMTGWEQKQFQGETQYQFQSVDGVTALTANSRAAASGLFKTRHIDLTKTPFLNWSWRVSQPLAKLDEQSKAGDDYAARVYVVVKGGLAFWRTKAINYVWSANSTQHSVWPNAFAGKQAMMLALRGPEAPLNTWQQEKRNIRADFKTLFDEDITAIDAIAIMTDTDNSSGTAAAAYGNIWFSKE